MANDPVERLRRCAEEAKARRREAERLEAELSSVSLTDEEEATASEPHDKFTAISPKSWQRRGLTSSKIVSHASRHLLQQEQLGLFTSIPIQAGNEFPTLIARLPIFPPVSEDTQRELLDRDQALPFDTAFGKGRRFGPLLTVQDEDVLQATSRLRSHRLSGKGGQLPIKIQQMFARGSNELYEVHSAAFTPRQLCEELDLVKGGSSYKRVLESLRRINGTVIELEVAKKERYFGSLATRGGGFKLIDIAWDLYQEEGMIYCQFNPLVVMWLEKEFTYVNWNIRKQLTSPTARALHRYLSSQPANYSDKVLKIAGAVGIWVPNKKLTSVFLHAMDQLVKVGWLASYELTGTGRNTPKMLHVRRAAKPTLTTPPV
jgi:hypothetical protein